LRGKQAGQTSESTVEADMLTKARLRKSAGIVVVGDLHDIAEYFVSGNNFTPYPTPGTSQGIKIAAKTIE
jgi:hypothetical protein